MAGRENPKPILEWPDDIDGQLQRARDIKKAIDAGSTGIVTTALGTAITDAQTAQDDVGLGTHGAVSTRNDKFAIMKQACVDIMDEVREATAGLSYDAALALIEANGFHGKGHAVISKKDFEARNGNVSGAVDLIAKDVKEEAAHEWYYSLDKTMTWIYLPTTLQSKTTASGFSRGQLVTFRHRIVLRTGPLDWHYFDVIIL